MAANVVLTDRPHAHVARVLINRPDKRNAIDHDVRQELTDTLSALLADSSVRALVFGGVGGTFSAGGDLPSMVGLSESQARARMQHIHFLCAQVAGAGIPVVSAIEGIGAGAAVGLALLGDYIVVGEGTQILFPFLKLGLTPDWGQLLTLPPRIGLPHTRRILVAGKPVTGTEALRIGLADALVSDEQVMDTAVAKAVELAQLPLGAFARMKDRLNNVSASLAEEFVREKNDQAVCLLGDDFVEGYDAFKNRRAADFTGKPRGTE
ncbi:enoyl-CoA hydratase/isomerase family protein [Paraburkholderia sp. USG1]|uniref:enoyl-CoA hydratase/isomerase family protein n=1 Tax=Paraburkholderia sp. USG1 TaxID=2952268 RepID=UPI00285545C5|nr:enoyl-CoA hydratase/isomerase family protein [Paraburkholderia sp. USG1]MDR8394726.1 enoyl-CoA hydratase/isomerase family protein [Paraburkholderia sp. USG1]